MKGGPTHKTGTLNCQIFDVEEAQQIGGPGKRGLKSDGIQG